MVAKVAKGQYVELAGEGEDAIFSVPGRVRHDSRRSAPRAARSGHPRARRRAGASSQRRFCSRIAQADNTTIWPANFDRQFYTKLLFFSEPPPARTR